MSVLQNGFATQPLPIATPRQQLQFNIQVQPYSHHSQQDQMTIQQNNNVSTNRNAGKRKSVKD